MYVGGQGTKRRGGCNGGGPGGIALPRDIEPSPADGVGDWLDEQMVATFPIDRGRVVMEVNEPALLGELDQHPLVRAAIRDSGLGTALDPQHLDEALIRLSGPIGRRITQAVSRAIYEVHPEAEAVEYRSRHDDTETCYALYHRGSAWDHTYVRRLTPAVADDRAAVRSASSLFEIDLPDRWAYGRTTNYLWRSRGSPD